MDADRSFVLVMGALVSAGSAVILVLLAILALESFALTSEGWHWNGLGAYAATFGDAQTYRVLLNSLELAVLATAVAFLFGVPIAWLVERTDLRGKAVVLCTMLVSMLVPGFASAMGWLFLLHPKIGVVNQLLAAWFGPAIVLNVVSIVGMGCVIGLQLAPVAFLMTSAALRAMDYQLEEAAFTAGAPSWAAIRRVVIPLARPALISAAIYVFVIAFGTFDVPAIIGWDNRIFTFSTYLYLQTSPQAGLPDFGRAGALSVAIVSVALVLAVWSRALSLDAQRFAVVSGKAYRPRRLALGRAGWAAYPLVGLYLLTAIVLPLAVIVWESFFPFVQPLSATVLRLATWANYTSLGGSAFFPSLANSVLLMAVVPLIVLVFSFAFSWIGYRTRLHGRTLLDGIAFLPHAVPSVVMAVGVIVFALYLAKYVVPLYGTIWIIAFAFVVTWISYGTRMTNTSLLQLHHELEESASIGGASTWSTVYRIVLPLIARGVLLAWMYLVILSGRELTLSVMMTTAGNTTVPAFVWTTWLNGGLTHGAAATLSYLLCLLPLIVAYSLLMNREPNLGTTV